jgi:phytoene dehydrogenase-like protein
MPASCDAVVVGAGHNGLVAANMLADAGWDVVVVEACTEPGGAVRSANVTAPGYRVDLFSAFYPMTAVSPVMKALHLEEHGLNWLHAPTVLAHVLPDRPGPVLYRDAERTAAAMNAEQPGDGEAWMRLHHQWERIGEPLIAALLGPFPPVRATADLVRSAKGELWDLARRAVLPVRTFASEEFSGTFGPLLLAGNALHADVAPEMAPSALLGWLLVGLGQTVGFPVPQGGSGRMTDALVGRMSAAGAELRLATPAEGIDVIGGRAVGVRTPNGSIRARRAVLAACDAQLLYGSLLDDHHLPPAFLARLGQFHRADATVKVNYALSSPVPWTDEQANSAGTVHLADSVDELTVSAAQIAAGQIPARPFLLVGQMTTADPTRSPPGTESLWTYTHIPQNVRGDAADQIRTTGRLEAVALEAFVERIEDRLEARAPGFRDRVVARHVQGPGDLERENPSLIGGDIGGGTSQLHQQLIFRPVPGLARPSTPIDGLFLASASAHPGGSVHGACGANAAKAALMHDRMAHARRLVPAAALAGLAGAAVARLRRR